MNKRLALACLTFLLFHLCAGILFAEKIVPMTTVIKNAGRQFNHEFPPYSFTVLGVKTR